MVVEGIDRLTPADFRHAATFGYGIKLLAIISRDFTHNELSVRVHPTLLPESHVVANVSGVFNAVSVKGDVVGTTLYIGRGAGQDATSSAVISDIVDAVSLLKNDRRAFVTARKEVNVIREGSTCRLAPPERIHGRYYLRLTVKDRPGVLARVATVMAEQHVSVASLIQNRAEQPDAASLVFTTHDSNERAIQTTITRLRKLSVVLEPPLLLRIGDFSE
jgi:homoserine dehydrogenase